MSWSPSNTTPVLITQEDSLNDSVTVTFSSDTPPSWSWDRGDLPAQVVFSPAGYSLTVSAPNWDGLFPIEVVYQIDYVNYTATSWADVPSNAMLVHFTAPSVNMLTFTFSVTVDYTETGGGSTTSTQTYTIEVYANYNTGKAQVQGRTAGRSGRPVSRKGDVGTGHGCFPPRPSTGGSPDVFIDGIPVLRMTDSWSTHRCGDNIHAGSQAGGADFVFVNGLAMARVGDAVDCGSAVAEGADFVYCD